MVGLYNISIYKQEIRKTICHLRKSITPEQQFKYAQQATARIIRWEPLVMAHNVALFLSHDGEIDTQPLINYLWNAGKKVYLPVIHPFISSDLLFLNYQPKSKLVINRLKIKEPKINIRKALLLTKLDILVTPLVAFDKTGNRLGMGGGFYDRILKYWNWYGFHPIGFAYDFQMLDFIPTEKWDIPLPAIVTPSKLWKW